MNEYSAKVHKKSQSSNIFAVTSGAVLRNKSIQISICSERQNKGLHSQQVQDLWWILQSAKNNNVASNAS